jgi:hypothetical protein
MTLTWIFVLLYWKATCPKPVHSFQNMITTILYAAIQLIPFELGLRFYTDYLEGNRYFKVTQPEQNLQRAASQFQLCESIMAQESAIKILIKQLRIQCTI